MYFHGRTDTYGVILRVKELLKGEKELLLGFNMFLPKGFEITIEGDQTLPDVDFDKAISYMKKIKVGALNLQLKNYNLQFNFVLNFLKHFCLLLLYISFDVFTFLSVLECIFIFWFCLIYISIDR